MKNIKAFHLNFSTVLLRYYLCMTIVIVTGFSGFWPFGLLVLPIFLSAILGVTYQPSAVINKEEKATKWDLTPKVRRHSPEMA